MTKWMYDIVIIGGGAGGLSLAAGASQLGAKVALIESGKMGGDCLNSGCVPSKSLLSAAKTYYESKNSQHFGIHADNVTLNFKETMQHVKSVIAHIAVHDSVERFESLGVNVILGRGEFLNKTTFKINNETITAKYFVIATGSSPFVPPIPGIDKITYQTNETIFDLNALPEHLIVIGGGPIGCELAQAFAMLGAKITILEAFKLLPKDDADCVQVIQQQFESMAISIHENIKIKEVKENTTKKITVTIEKNGKEQKISGSHLLVATGRRANVNGFGLEKASIQYTDKGIGVDARLRTSNKKIYAIGDVAGGLQFTHMANYHAGIVLRNILFKLPAKVNYTAAPWVTYTLPEMAHVGKIIDATKKQNKLIEFSFSENDRAQAEHHTSGKIKVMTNKKGVILGVTIVGQHAGELLLPWIIAVREKKKLRSFTDTIVPYPTLSEISKRVASEFYTPIVFSQKMRRLVEFLLKF